MIEVTSLQWSAQGCTVLWFPVQLGYFKTLSTQKLVCRNARALKLVSGDCWMEIFILAWQRWNNNIMAATQMQIKKTFIHINIRKLSVASLCDQFLITCRPNFSVVWWLIVAKFLSLIWWLLYVLVIVWFRCKCLWLSCTIIKNLLNLLNMLKNY